MCCLTMESLDRRGATGRGSANGQFLQLEHSVQWSPKGNSAEFLDLKSAILYF